MYKPITPLLHSFLLLVLIGTYGSVIYYLKAAPTEPPVEVRTATAFPTPAPPVPAAGTRLVAIPRTAAPESGWSLVQPGLEQRVFPVYGSQGQPVETVHVWRLDQNRFRLDVAFSATPKSLEAWQKETQAELVVNAGYFSLTNEKYSADGLTIIDGKASGRSFAGYGGMLAIHGPRAELRWLVEKPYDPGERLTAALQSFPILVQPGGKLGFGPEREDHASARRTVVAQDKQGRILFIVAPQGYFTLHQLSTWLTGSSLDINIAINLDGGGSTGLLLATPQEIIPSKVLLPFVILVYAR
jgi:hypothetical protein